MKESICTSYLKKNKKYNSMIYATTIPQITVKHSLLSPLNETLKYKFITWFYKYLYSVYSIITPRFASFSMLKAKGLNTVGKWQQVAKPSPVMVNSLKILTIMNQCCRVHLKFFGRLAFRR